MILLIDNYDSFTYNLVQLVAKYDAVEVLRNDDSEIFEKANEASAIIISPGPGTPKETGFVPNIIRKFYKSKPMLGICLGHQTIAEVFGSEIILAKNIRHGKQSFIAHGNSTLFKELARELPVIRYHSLVMNKQQLPPELIVTAEAIDDQEIMAIEHKKYPVFGVQFHPESIGTLEGEKIIQNFMKIVEDE